ncbi:phage portal protein [Listeria grandensis]|uniref:Phage portal protein n=1 Tax=Listeria grandensis TaxID=1494963 RepID=A0A7X1CQM6_9LIST|nr:phage portal protein [Listeria grandensis]
MKGGYNVPDIFTLSRDTELTSEVVEDFIKKHGENLSRYKELMDLYKGKHPILTQDAKATYKPDNRLVVNFAKYIVDTLNGYCASKPIKTTHTDKAISEKVSEILKLNDQDDNDAEISKMCSIYGHAYEMLYQDEDTQTCITYLSPEEAFVVYDKSVRQAPYFAVWYSTDEKGKISGKVYTAEQSYDIAQGESGFAMTESEENESYYGDIPIIEHIENEERESIISSVESLIKAYNKAISEKANDVDYFADAYLAVLGAELDEGGVARIRDNRIINLFGTSDASKILVQFLDKPDGDQTQENLIDRLERLIYQMSMVSNINDEDFGNASGVAMAFKLQSMENLALMKERKKTSAINRRWKLIFGLVTNFPVTQKDEWRNLEHQYTRNIPHNVKEEAEVAGDLTGIVSKQTALKGLSVVQDVEAELERIKAEKLEEVGDDYDEIGDGGEDDAGTEPGVLDGKADKAVE